MVGGRGGGRAKVTTRGGWRQPAVGPAAEAGALERKELWQEKAMARGGDSGCRKEA
jgi:hypothetical protein